MDRVKSQAAVVSQLLFDPKTADAYKNVLALTGKIIKEVALLAWLLICSVFVFGAWFSDTAINSGRNARKWWQKQQTVDPQDGAQTAAATGKALLDVSQNGAYFLLDKAREQLGLDKVDRPATTEAPKTQPIAKTVTQTTETMTADKVTAVAKEAKTVVTKTTSDFKASVDSSVAEKS
ncbi:hypothetical protein [Leptothoe spongobia]|uniref:Uncharacterized protein n=1 Tax=Leptothoe spongobia TAU-MAC 1115 TaxID=1967444 RepID=A0A947DDM9_9CYAN|nr:hypothetical protein [Leptothoe spongobia]MBT9314960.1 hypothetical protein [Leptothoe spongobia TAU-MAC 1115]